MRKLLFAFFITIISLFITTPAQAKQGELFYDITRFAVEKEQVVFEGWAYIQDYNNYGKGADHSQNTTIAIYPKLGDKVYENVKYEIEYHDKINNKENGLGRALFNATCLKNSNEVCYNDYDRTTRAGTRENHVHYDNIGFKIRINISDINKTIGDDSYDKTIEFVLRVENDGKRMDKNTEPHQYSNETVIAVSTEAAKGIQNNVPMYGGITANITVSGISEYATIRVVHARLLVDKDKGQLIQYKDSNLYWGNNEEHKINKVSITNRTGYEGLKIYNLYYKEKYFTNENGKTAVRGIREKYQNFPTAWAYATWINVTGSVHIKLTKPNNECPEEYKNLPKLECENGIFEEIKNVKLNTTLTINKNDSRYNELRNKKINKGSCSTDLTATITSDLTITQTAIAEFGLTATTVDAGRGFYFDTKISGKASYQLCEDIKYQISEYESVYSCPDKSTVGKKISSGKESNYSWEKYSKFTNVTPNNDNCQYAGNIITKYEFLEDTYKENKKSKLEFENNICKSTEVKCQQGKCSCEVTGESTSAIESKKELCEENNGQTYSCKIGNCPKSIIDEVEKEMTKYLKTTTNYKNQLGANVYTKDSNKATENTEPNTKMAGNWNINYSKPTIWGIGQEVNYDMNFYLKTACINTRTAEVKYIDGDNCDNLNYGGEFDEQYIDGSNSYYVPLKELDGSYFPVQVKINDFSVVNTMTWNLDYECGVNCKQKIYDIDPPSASYKFIYRPVSLKDPFPRNVIGTNWISFMQDKKAIESKMNRNNLEYSALLTPNDIARIVRYNKNKNYTGLDTINNNGTSSFIKEILKQPMGSRFSTNVEYNKMGECTKNCWLSKQEEVD